MKSTRRVPILGKLRTLRKWHDGTRARSAGFPTCGFAGFRQLASCGLPLPLFNVFRMFSQMSGKRVPVESTAAVPLDMMLRSGVRESPDVAGFASHDPATRKLAIMVWHYHDDDLPGPDAAVELALSGLSGTEASLSHFGRPKPMNLQPHLQTHIRPEGHRCPVMRMTRPQCGRRGSSAELHSAVSPSCTRQAARKLQTFAECGQSCRIQFCDTADCNSALRQSVARPVNVPLSARTDVEAGCSAGVVRRCSVKLEDRQDARPAVLGWPKQSFLPLLHLLCCMVLTLQVSAVELTVALDGSGQFTNVQDAIMSVPAGYPGNPVIIRIKPGTYREQLYIQREKRYFRLIGEDADTTILSYALHANLPGADGKPIGTFRTPSFQLDADDFIAEDLTFENAAGPVGQALAIRVDGDRAVFRRCRFLGWQDTILVNRGRQYFEDCYIAGHVDFIFGAATVWFERCHIHCLRNGYITAASTPHDVPYGFVFANCRITGESDDVKTYLGRPWRDYSSVTFLNTEMSGVVRPEGWHNWNRPEREQTVRYAEFHSTGPGANPAARVAWSRQLTEAEARVLTPQTVLRGKDGWDPHRATLQTRQFYFGSGDAGEGWTHVAPGDGYDATRGYGFDLGSTVEQGRGGITATNPFFFSVALEEGNYDVTVTLGGSGHGSTNTVKAESRRLMLERVVTGPGEVVTRRFTVNIRTPAIAGGGAVRLKDREKGVLHWDDKLTLEFNGTQPAVASVAIAPAPDTITVFLLGDSTVTDQPMEPWNSWGQMLTRFFQSGVAVANHAESGESLKNSLGARRVDKVFSQIRPGDYLFVQFGHNDMKDSAPDALETYRRNLTQLVVDTRARGATPVLITSMERMAGAEKDTLAGYPDTVREVARAEGVALIDLHAMSRTLYQALESNLKSAFQDGTHHNAYGSYLLAKCVVEGIRQNHLPLVRYVVGDMAPFHPAQPDPLDDFDVPASPSLSERKPDGD